jgi:hypothetical protein
MAEQEEKYSPVLLAGESFAASLGQRGAWIGSLGLECWSE